MNSLQRLTADTRYCLAGLPASALSFSVTIAGVAAGVGSAVAFVGLPVLAGTAGAARRFADFERGGLAEVIDRPLAVPDYSEAPSWAGWFRRTMHPLTRGQAFLDLLHAIINFPFAIVAFVITVTWWAGAIAGLTFPLYGWILYNLSESQTTLPELLGLGDGLGAYLGFSTLAGVLFALTLIPVVRTATLLRASLAQALLTRPVYGTRPRPMAMAAL
ncbi:sensor domain-containing protein [Nonomuraea sp. NPDC050310]|uniref:sensor domain-containing protein n=1 Tax=unclassified Nonomuraea TaxID=2593643 RepID=UPI0033CFAC7B